jgi:hypothetical protein
MLTIRSIKSLYQLAFSEGEGIGTAYEYFAKRLVLGRWLTGRARARRVLIAGLPEKYGSSLDFLLIAQELGATEIVVAEDRPGALEKGRQGLAAAQAMGELNGLQPQFVLCSDLERMPELTPGFDVCLGSEVLQRLSPAAGQQYVTTLTKLARAIALFAPNGDNPSHTNISGLSGLRLTDLNALLQKVGTRAEVGYIDMPPFPPPFPPGITRSAVQRQQASNGRLEGMVMWGLAYYARLERSFPKGWRRHYSHIVYALSPPTSS